MLDCCLRQLEEKIAFDTRMNMAVEEMEDRLDQEADAQLTERKRCDSIATNINIEHKTVGEVGEGGCGGLMPISTPYMLYSYRCNRSYHRFYVGT